MRWPWQTETEKRQTFANDVLDQVFQAATVAPAAAPAKTAAVEAVAAFVGSALASASLEGASPRLEAAFGPETRSLVGRELIRRGECLFRPTLMAGRWSVDPIASHTMTGNADPSTWRYLSYFNGPSGTTSQTLGRDAVLHFRYAWTRQAPWRGIPAHELASETARALASTTNSLADESSGPRGQVLPILESGPNTMNPGGDGAKPEDRTTWSRYFAALKGGLAVQKILAPRVNEAHMVKPGDWKPSRIGPAPEEASILLLDSAFRQVVSCYGPGMTALFSPMATPAAAREAYRQAVAAVIEPLGARVAEELNRFFGESVTLSFERLASVDIAARVRGVKGLVDAGVSLEDARAAAGI